jgi:beta-aspartyl-dipeptidase (metallo-type)
LLHAIQTLLESGAALETFLPVFTSNIANLLSLSGKGTIAAGADADIAVITPSGELVHVLAMGEFMVRDGDVAKYGSFETEL